jgi:uncharacterized coiled-coil DUF342 family protein
MMKKRTIAQIKSEIAKLQNQLKALETKPKTKRELAFERAERAAEWACNPASESYWCS